MTADSQESACFHAHCTFFSLSSSLVLISSLLLFPWLPCFLLPFFLFVFYTLRGLAQGSHRQGLAGGGEGRFQSVSLSVLGVRWCLPSGTVFSIHPNMTFFLWFQLVPGCSHGLPAPTDISHFQGLFIPPPLVCLWP